MNKGGKYQAALERHMLISALDLAAYLCAASAGRLVGPTCTLLRVLRRLLSS